MKKISPFLWFDTEAEDAAVFYASIFPNSKIKEVAKYSADNPSNKPKGSVMTVNFELDGNEFTALNGGPLFKFNEAISFTVPCRDQKEIDYFWEKLTAGGGQPGPCGWLKDKFGISWQIVPENMAELVSSENGMKAMLEMKKIEIAELEKANKG